MCDTGSFRRSNAFLPLAIAGGCAAGLLMRSLARPSFDWKERVVIITGGSRGLGLTLARELIERQAKVAICARDPLELHTAERELRSAGGEVFTFVCDITKRSDVENFVVDVIQELGPIDVLINNAGVIVVGPEASMSIDDYDQLMGVHFWGPLFMTRAVLPGMKERRAGRIVNIASIGAKLGVPHLAPYTASKFALAGWSESMRIELESSGISVTTVYPGLMRTGSQINVVFRGDHAGEYAWFRTVSAVPLLTMSPEAAARRILSAAGSRQSEVVLGLPAKLAALLHGVSPRSAIGIARAANAILPSASGSFGPPRRGRELPISPLLARVTGSIERAAASHNEIGVRTFR